MKKVIIKENEMCSFIDFLNTSLAQYSYLFINDLIEQYGSLSEAISSDDYETFINEKEVLYLLYSRCVSKRTDELTEYDEYKYNGSVELTNREIKILKLFIEFNLFSIIRNNDTIENMTWLYNIVNIWKRCNDISV